MNHKTAQQLLPKIKFTNSVDNSVNINSTISSLLQIPEELGVSEVMGVPNSWMIFVMENPNLKWMIWGTPMDWKPSY